MCLAVPMKIEKIEGNEATCEISGVRYPIRIDLIHDPKPGEYILAHAGVGIEKINEEEVQELVKLYKEIGKDISYS